jgi:hypothetical protein
MLLAINTAITFNQRQSFLTMASNDNQYSYTTPPTTRASETPPPAPRKSNPISSTVNPGIKFTAINFAPNGPSQHLLNQIEARMGQILDDADHRRCSEGNQRALLAEKLENLRQLTKELEKDEWMYAPKKANSGLTLTRMPEARNHPF